MVDHLAFWIVKVYKLWQILPYFVDFKYPKDGVILLLAQEAL